MTLIEIIRLLARYLGYIMACAILLSALVFWSTKNDKEQFASHTLLNTGLISGYNIESNKSSRVDYARTNNELENLINLATSYETNKEVSARLIARLYLDLQEGTLSVLAANHKDLKESLSGLNMSLSGQNKLENLYAQIIQLRDADQTNALYLLTNSDNPFVGTEQLESISVTREGKSDMIRMEYSSIDPFISQYTLELLTSIFMKKHRGIKEGQSNSVIGFFEEATLKTSNKLKAAEDELLNFRVGNKIINYYEQTRFISGNKEELDKQFQKELRVMAAAKSALDKVEMEIADKSMLPMIQAEIATNRQALSGFVSRRSQLDLLNDTMPDSPEEFIQKTQLNTSIDSLKTAINLAAEQVFQFNLTPEGIETKDLLTQWLNNTIAKEESAARLTVMKKRQQEYGAIYDQFAPLGSTLKRLEREIDVAEREYLENLHSYNQARLHKYNMLMSSDLKVIDSPYYPVKPEKSKRMLLIVVAFMAGIVLPSGLLIALEMMDSTLKKPDNASEHTGLKIAGIFPKVQFSKKSQKIDFKQLNNQALNLLIQKLESQCDTLNSPKEVMILSMNPTEGKSFLIDQMNGFLGQDGGKENSGHDFSFTELPSLLHHNYDKQLVKKADAHLLVCRADRRWTAADKHALKVYKKISGCKPLLLLNGVSTPVMEDVVGEIPRSRSWLRQWVRQILTHGLRPSTAF